MGDIKTDIWFDCVDGGFESLVFRSDEVETGVIVIPAIGEKVGIWQDSDMPENAVLLHFVVDVRYFISPELQDIHVLCSRNR
jgi:hypothetical protein